MLYSHARQITTANGPGQRRIFTGAEVAVMGRNKAVSVMGNDETTPALIGYPVLKSLAFVVDPTKQKLIGNSERDRQWIADLY